MKKIFLQVIAVFYFIKIIYALDLKVDEINFFDSYKYRDIYYNLPLQTTVQIIFSQVVDTTTLNNDSIKIYHISNAKGEIINSTVSYTIDLSTSPSVLSIKLFVQLNYNDRYELVISTKIKTPPPIQPLDKEYKYTFFSVISTTFSSVVLKEPYNNPPSSIGNIELLIPQNEFEPQKVYFTTYLLTPTTEYVDKLKTLPNGCSLLQIAEFKAFSSTCAVEETESFVEIKGYGYNRNCSFYYLDKDKVFVRINSYYDNENNTLISYVNKFGIYAVVEEPRIFDVVSNIRCYPVPWAPDSEKISLGNYIEGIKFDNLPYDCVIEIYTLSGKLVHRKKYTDLSGIYHWDGKNDNYEDCSSGVYFWQVKTPTAIKTGKLIIIR